MLGQDAPVEGVAAELDQAIGEAALPASRVAFPLGSGQRLEGGSERGPGLAVELAAQPQTAALGGGELEEAGLDLVDLLGEEAAGVAGVAEVGTVPAELSDRTLPGPAQQEALVDAVAPRLAQPVGGAGDQAELTDANIFTQ